MNTNNLILFNNTHLRQSLPRITHHSQAQFDKHYFTSPDVQTNIDGALACHKLLHPESPPAIVVHCDLYEAAKAHLESRPETARIVVLMTSGIGHLEVWTEIKETPNA